MEPEQLRQEVEKIQWYHTIDLGNGIITPGLDNTPERLKQIGMSQSLEGVTVLDIGAWNGFFSFEAERRGASLVLATDSFCWRGEGRSTKAGFDLAKKILNSKIDEKEIDVLELSPESVGVFDLVLFLGVFYHMRHPLLALEHVASVTGKQLIIDTELDMIGYRRPVMAFYPDSELANDSTNWWGPNPAAVIAALKTVGFRRVSSVYPSRLRLSLPWRVARALKNAALKGDRFPANIRRGRMVFHAWR